MTGRPSSYTIEIADIICEAIAQGGALYKLCEERDDFPGERTVYQWLEVHEEFAQKYTRARARQADRSADEIVVIADTDPDPQRARNRMDARKWHSSKLAPKKYGDSTMLKHADADGEKLTIQVVEFREGD